MNFFMTILMLSIVYIPMLVIFAMTPYITRKTESFGISIPQNIYDNVEVKKIRENYRNNVIMLGSIIFIISLIIAFYVPHQLNAMVLPAGVCAEIGFIFVLYLKNHRKMKELKQKNNWLDQKSQKIIVDTSFRQKIKRVSPWWFLSYIVIILATVSIGLIMYEKIPNQIPMNYALNGEITRWVQKSYKVLFYIPFVQLFIMILMVFVYWIIGKAKQQIDAAHPVKSIKQNTAFRYRWSAFTVFMGLLLLIMFGFMQLTMIGMIQNLWFVSVFPMIMTCVIIFAAIFLSITTGQGGSRIPILRNSSNDVVNRDDDKHWKLGMFYYNPDDPAVFVEKRFGVGWTNNFARPLSWILLIGLFVLIIALSFGSSYLLK